MWKYITRFLKCVSGGYLKILLTMLTILFATKDYYYWVVLNILFKRKDENYMFWSYVGAFFRLYQIVKFKITEVTFYVITFKVLAF